MTWVRSPINSCNSRLRRRSRRLISRIITAMPGAIRNASSDNFQFRYNIQPSRPITATPSLTSVTSAWVVAVITWVTS